MTRRESDPLPLLPPEVHDFALRAAEVPYPVLLHGETGSGKTHLAEAIHRLSPRSGKPFVPVNCSAITEGLFESELFGHEKGAFTGAIKSRLGLFEVADGGTLFLDELGKLHLNLQPKLLRVVEKGSVRRVGSSGYTPVDVRIIAATNRDLREMIRRNEFREDLYYRCAVLEHRIPPLRERRREIPAIISFLLTKKIAPASDPPEISADALEVLFSYPWPGNIRQLNNALCHAVTYSEGGIIEVHHLPDWIHLPDRETNGESEGRGAGAIHRYAAPESLRQERTMILQALQAEGGNRTQAAKRLGMSRQTLWIKTRCYAIAADEWEKASNRG